MRVPVFYAFLVCLGLVIVFGCSGGPTQEQKNAAAAQAAEQAAQQAAVEKMHDLGRQMQSIQREMADESAREPGKALEITAKFMPRLTAIDAQVAQLPQAQKDEFARTYRKN